MRLRHVQPADVPALAAIRSAGFASYQSSLSGAFSVDWTQIERLAVAVGS